MTQVSLVLRKRPRKSLTGGPTIADLKEGSKVSGTVKRVEAFGALLEISKDLSALLHKSEADQDRFIENPAKEWAVGQRLTAIVIRVSKKGVQVGTKRCYFEAAGFSEIQIAEFLNGNHSAQGRAASMHEEVEANLMDIDVVKVDIHDEGRDIMSEKVIDQDESADEIDVAMQETTVSDDEEEMVNSEEWNKMPVDDDDEEVPALDIGVGFEFEEATSLDISKTVENANNPNDMESARTASAPDAEKKTSREKREKKRMREASEKAIRLREEALAKNPDAPETAADFERLLVGEPNCSVLWIRYMAFCLSLHQVDKARSVAERALDTISLSEESHRSNIWMAYLNLEAQYGAANSVSETVSDNLGLHRDAAVFRVFDRACERVTDVEKLHLQAAAALRDTSTRIADEILHRASRKFKRSSTVWIAIGEVQFKSGDKKSGRRTLERALAGLEETDHVRVISKFAQFEYKYGSSERGRTVFESLVSNFPKRLDLWNVYLDMETNKCREDDGEERQQMIDSSRNLFEKCTALDWSSKKMKSVFQKWLTFEKRFGTKQHRKEVKEKARQYVERSVAAKV